MRIACIAAVDIPSSKANSIQVMKACQALSQLGHEVTLLVPQGSAAVGSLPPSLVELRRFYGLQTDFPLEWLPANRRWKRYDFCWRAVRWARQREAEIVYAWPLQAAVFALLWQLPVLLEMHGPPEGLLAPWLFRLFLAWPGPKRLLPISRALLTMLGEAAGHHSAVVSPNGVDLERYRDLPSPSAVRQALGLRDVPTVGYSGHLYAGRGMNLLVELARRFPNVQFLWVGGHPEDVASWQRRVADDGLHNILLTGFVANSVLPSYQAACDVLLMPYERAIAGSSGGNSAAYCSPMKLFEYMACGRAILSSDLPVIREVLGDHNAVLCPPEDPDAWAESLQCLLYSPEQRQALAERARSDVTSYTWLERERRALEGFHG